MIGDVIAVLVAVAWIGLVFGAIAWIGLRLRRRSIRRGNYPVRILPWYLGGTPEMPLDPPDAEPRRRSERRS